MIVVSRIEWLTELPRNDQYFVLHSESRLVHSVSLFIEFTALSCRCLFLHFVCNIS